ncbi:polar amino acid transport system substrate-binding protein [Inquilinus ginsengisoli]|uniref:transporter substrate-binding domain-containing protein n=1 Tax=Inquilinus ginsengisoli TaxID=363840 RepID=UPI003D19452A
MSARLWVLTIMAAVALALPAAAQEPQRVVPVAVRVIPPMVEQTNGQLSGFSIDLWNAIASRRHWTTAFTVVPSVQAQLAAVSARAADVGVGAISITAERITDYDFSQPILNAGLGILTRSQRPGREANAFGSLLHLLLSPAVLVWLGIAGLLTIIPAHIVWFVERGQPDGIIGTRRYFPGIFQAFFWGLGTLATQADAMPRHWISRGVAVLWMFTGVVFVAFYTATLTASLTVQQIRQEINGPGDLPGKAVGTVGGTTSARYLGAAGIQSVAFANAEDAYQALIDDQVDAVVYDAPVLQYIAAHKGLGRAGLAGPVFQPEDYGFVFRNDSDLRRDVDAALLSMRQDGSYEELRQRWFGKG